MNRAAQKRAYLHGPDSLSARGPAQRAAIAATAEAIAAGLIEFEWPNKLTITPQGQALARAKP